MKIDINKDFVEAFPNEVYSGFTLRQCMAAASGRVFTAGRVPEKDSGNREDRKKQKEKRKQHKEDLKKKREKQKEDQRENRKKQKENRRIEMMNAKKEKRNAKKKKRKEKKGGSDHGNLEPGREYTMTGRLMYKDTGKAVSVYGKEVTASQTFTPKEKGGSVKLTFTVGVHADLSDKDQTVEYPKDKTPDKPSDDKPSGDNARRTVTSSPKTGDDTNLALWIGILLVSAAGAAITVILLIRKRRKKKTW